MDMVRGADSLENALIQKAMMTHTPVYVVLELTPLCNMDCDMCFIRLSRDEMERNGRLRTAEEWIALAQQMRDAGTLFVLLTGGEPLLHPGFREIYLALLKMGMIVSINTNATLIDEEWAAFFAAHRPRRINVTLYGANADTYEALCHHRSGFDQAVRAIRLLREGGVAVKINNTVTRANYDDRFLIQQLASELDAPVQTEIYIMPATRERSRAYDFDSRLDPHMAAQLRVEMMKQEMTSQDFVNQALGMLRRTMQPQGDTQMHCQAGRSACNINWQGKMRPCVMLTGPEYEVFELGFLQSWQMLCRHIAGVRLSSECGRCRLRDVCDTCAACALHESGRIDGVPEYMCRYMSETMNILVQELLKMGVLRTKDNQDG